MELDLAVVATIGLVVLAFIFLIGMSVLRGPCKWWLVGRISGANLSMRALIRLRLRRLPMEPLAISVIRAHKAGIAIELKRLVEHHRAGGDHAGLISALIAARLNDIVLTLEDAAAMDLAGSDPLSWVRAQLPPQEQPPLPRWSPAKVAGAQG